MQQLDSCKPPTGPSLLDLSKDPRVAEMLIAARAFRTPERWQEIARDTKLASVEEREVVVKIWRQMPGDTCFLDAARLIAFARTA